jgi:hypothetical protein
MSYECKYCNKKLSTQSSLTLHQQTTIACLSIQESMNIITVNTRVTCDYCKQSFTKNNLSKHMKVCKFRPNNDLTHKDNEISRLKDELIKKDNEISRLKDEFTHQLQLETSILKVKLEIYKEMAENNRDTLDKLSARAMHTVEEIAKLPIEVNNNTIDWDISENSNYEEDEEYTCCD